MTRNAYNKIQLLIEYKMMESRWMAWTEDSYASELLRLDDCEIIEFINKSDEEISSIQCDVNKFYYEYVRD